SILKAYGERCAVCGFDVKISGIPVAIEAAHIKWRQVNGPDIESNGIALCVMHHRLFDRGAFTIDRKYMVHVSENVGGECGVEEWLLRFQGQMIQDLSRIEYPPAEEFLGWHHSEVFHGSLP